MNEHGRMPRQRAKYRNRLKIPPGDDIVNGIRLMDHKGLVCMWALRMGLSVGGVNRDEHVEDSTQFADGFFGLLKAAERFDASLGNTFATYATYWIRKEILRGMEHVQPVRIPAHTWQLLLNWRKVAGSLEAKLGRPPTDQETDKESRMLCGELALVKAARGAADRTTDRHQLEEIHEQRRNVEDEVIEADEMESLKGSLRSAISTLRPRHAFVITRRFAIDCERQTLEQIASVLGVTRQRVEQLEKEVLKKLQKRIADPLES